MSPSDYRVVGFPDWWAGVIRIEDIIDRNYTAYGYFFDAVYRNPQALAGRRGAPPRMSQEALADAGDLAELTAASWILWSEIQASDWHTRPELGALGWNLLFTLMRDLADVYGGDRIRLVVWFSPDLRVDG